MKTRTMVSTKPAPFPPFLAESPSGMPIRTSTRQAEGRANRRLNSIQYQRANWGLDPRLCRRSSEVLICDTGAVSWAGLARDGRLRARVASCSWNVEMLYWLG